MQGGKFQTPVDTGAFRFYVPEKGSSEHPHFVMCWQIMIQSHAGRNINQAVVCLGKRTCLFLTTPVSRSVLSLPQLFASLSLVHGGLANSVEDPVHFGSPAAVVSVVHLLHEVVEGLLL